MELVLERLQLLPDTTIGSLTVNGAWQCWTLEDVVRAPGVKVYAHTAIPAGRYRVQITMSPRFKRRMPLLLDVPGFSGIRIHPGNTHEDTEGCILVGQQRLERSLLQSRAAYENLMIVLEGAERAKDDVFITVQDYDPS
ncbi:DUF5675 family protein [Rubrivivax rivuli]|uniref:DUF5675 domain-containing protein n=1 Tax=Rubrivivax rivuli TaxID=1862385 RepID=A0A437REY6_9BURK|nr:DUF5675 family protein [Rubrivivax rivuli]RVU45337.1 hypothetical protein EOE66_14515 [Rubrivivax rivuli]